MAPAPKTKQVNIRLPAATVQQPGKDERAMEDHYYCVGCDQPHAKVDEDGCCSVCGRDCVEEVCTCVTPRRAAPREPWIDREFLLLKIRNAIADKEWAAACGNMETARSGAWSCDWYQDIRRAEGDLQRWFAMIDSLQPNKSINCRS
jgi:hypothetical protein